MSGFFPVIFPHFFLYYTMTGNTSKTVAVAMSGGVDSSVAAALLLEAGYSVLGITMLHYESPCRKAHQAVQDAAAVCRTLDIPHHVVEMRQTFQDRVIEPFIAEYLAGRTPNPCVQCNVKIKWGELLQEALVRGATHLATGHYVNLEFNKHAQRFQLRRSQHRAKDQSYALWQLTQPQLAHTLFPISDTPKSRVRQKAAELGLDVAHTEESQDICFIPDDDYKQFLIDILKQRGQVIEPGPIVDMQDNVIGQHKGYPFYTIGQRKGLGVALGRPMFVVEIDAQRNQIRIGEKSELFAAGLRATSANWVAVEQPSVGMQVTAHIRYNDPGYAAALDTIKDDTFTVHFDVPRLSVTPGQSVVLYDGDLLIGGGIISKALSA